MKWIFVKYKFFDMNYLKCSINFAADCNVIGKNKIGLTLIGLWALILKLAEQKIN